MLSHQFFIHLNLIQSSYSFVQISLTIMTDSIIPLRFNVEEVGKHVKSSKKRFTWELSMNGRSHSIVLDFSFISGKVKVAVDRKVLLENQLPANTSFQYPFTLDGNSLNVIQQGESFQLRINNKVFSHLYNQAKTNKQFKKYEDQVKDFKVNENQFQAKKLTLNIGGVGGGMKKKPKNQFSEGHAWNAFGEQQMNGFPNYFQGQSVSTAASSSKVEQVPSTKKVGSLLDEDSGLGLIQTSSQKGQNILDFESQLQKTPIQAQQIPTKGQQEFSTMQMMFQTMNLNPTGQQGQGSVVIDSSEVDFFSSAQEQKPQQNQGQVDFFLGVDSATVAKGPQVLPVSELQTNDFSTMQYMFATNQGMGNMNNLQSSFNTSSKVQSGQNWNTQTNNQPITLGVSLGASNNNGVSLNTGVNLNSQPAQQQINPNNFSTLQGLFATNAIGISQPNLTVNNTPTQQQPSNNFSLNTQHFATQGVPTQGFGTSFNVNAQQFGTNFMGQQQGFSQDMSFLQQQKPTVQQPILTSQSPVQQAPQINMNDFNSMQMLFKTNAVQPNIQQQIPIQPQAQKTSSMDSFSQQFATMGASTTQSPSSLLMNTYGGSNNVSNLSFDLSTNPQQFSTSVNPSSMMKKKTTAPVFQATNASDLL